MNPEENDARKQYLRSKTGDFASFASMIGDEFATKINRLAQIIGTSHELSVGNYKESLLRDCISQHLPKRYSVGTGFVVFFRESPLKNQAGDSTDLLNLKEHYITKQLDIIVFDDHNYAPIFRDGDFVILTPESVKSVIEVKGYLTKTTVVSAIDSLIDFARKWKEYQEYSNAYGHAKKMEIPFLHLMGFDVYVDNNGHSDCNGEILRKTIVERYRSQFTEEELKAILGGSNPTIPIINNAYIYSDCAVSLCGYWGGMAYSTGRGRFVRYDKNKEPSLAGDLTISSLLASIKGGLDTPFNPDFNYFDQSVTYSVCMHENAGLTNIITGQEVSGAPPVSESTGD